MYRACGIQLLVDNLHTQKKTIPFKPLSSTSIIAWVNSSACVGVAPFRSNTSIMSFVNSSAPCELASAAGGSHGLFFFKSTASVGLSILTGDGLSF